MAELLVLREDQVRVNDNTGSYNSGDIIVAMPDGWGWGKEERKSPADGGKFVIIKLPGVPVNDVLKYQERVLGIGNKTLRRRKYKIDVSLMNKSQSDLFATGKLNVANKTDLLRAIVDKATMVREA